MNIVRKVQYVGLGTENLTRLKIYLLNLSIDFEYIGMSFLFNGTTRKIIDDKGYELLITVPSDDWEPIEDENGTN